MFLAEGRAVLLTSLTMPLLPSSLDGLDDSMMIDFACLSGSSAAKRLPDDPLGSFLVVCWSLVVVSCLVVCAKLLTMISAAKLSFRLPSGKKQELKVVVKGIVNLIGATEEVIAAMRKTKGSNEWRV